MYLRRIVFQVNLDLILRFVPPMSEHDAGFRLTRTFELPFAPSNGTAVFSRDWEGMGDPLGYVLKNATWDIDRKCFLAETVSEMCDIPIAIIPLEIRRLVDYGWTIGSYADQYSNERKRGRKRGKIPKLTISDWDEEDAESWDSDKTERPKEFKTVWHAVVAMMADLWNNCPVAYAMLRTGVHVEVPKEEFKELSPLQTRFRDAVRDFETLTFDQRCVWRERVVGRYPRMSDVVEAI